MRKTYTTDKAALAFLVLAISYLLVGMLFGVVGGFQYILPDFLKDQLSFQKTRPLHVYLVIAWIFTAAQGCLYYFLPRITNRPMYAPRWVTIHFWMQLLVSLGVITAFVLGRFGGREYLEFPPWFGLLIILSWIPFAVNFMATLRPNYARSPVYVWSWSAGILFFFITLSESYLWLLDYFNSNTVRDVTVQWKALGSMVGSWNMMVYGCAFYVMDKMKGDEKTSRQPVAFFFFFLGLTNLMFNWGHHTYIVPAASWIRTTSYLVSMTELIILANIIFYWRKNLRESQKNYNRLPYRLLSFADAWIFLNLAVAIAISIPALNFFTHGTHITVAHAMGATIGINTMLLFGAIFYIVKLERPLAFARSKRLASWGIYVANSALLVFWISLIGSGLVKIASRSESLAFSAMMQKAAPYFKLFAISGAFVLLGILLLSVWCIRCIASKESVAAAPQLVEEEHELPLPKYNEPIF